MAITGTQATEKYKLLSGSHTASRITYRSGVKGNDILELTKEQAEKLGEDRLQKLSAEEARQEGKGDTKEKQEGEDSPSGHDDNLNTDLIK